MLPDGQPVSAHAMVASPDKQTLISLAQRNISTYSFASNTWTGPSPFDFLYTGITAAADPVTGLVYLPHVFEEGPNMRVFQPADNTWTVAPKPPLDVDGCSLIWSTARKRLLLYSKASTPYPHLLEFDPTKALWTSLKTIGDQPGAVSNHCMTSAYKGTKMVLFGGVKDGKTSGSIYILDVQTLSWKKGADIDTSQARNSMACTAAGDSFVAFGGGTMNKQPGFKDMLIYNLKTDKWTDQFYLNTPPPAPNATTTIAPSTTESGTTPTASTLPDEKPSGGSNGGVIGGAVVTTIIVPIILVLVYRRYKSRHDGKEQSRSDIDGRKGFLQHWGISLKAFKKATGDDKGSHDHHSASPPPSTSLSGSPTLFPSPSTTSSHPDYTLSSIPPEVYTKSALESPSMNDRNSRSSTNRTRTRRQPQDYSQEHLLQERQNARDPQRQSVMTPSQQTWNYQQQPLRNPQYHFGRSPQQDELERHEHQEHQLPHSQSVHQSRQQSRDPQRISVVSPLQETWDYHYDGERHPQYQPGQLPIREIEEQDEQQRENDDFQHYIPPPEAGPLSVRSPQSAQDTENAHTNDTEDLKLQLEMVRNQQEQQYQQYEHKQQHRLKQLRLDQEAQLQKLERRLNKRVA
ncbi:acyl-CoA-binding domain-containing protein 4 [Haplosporangium sp. Z 767]|nr:acyl-CoA-binding domain-containing protein 4 [Haplosporangium sp. Z 767]KAF9195732.1 acyl-CoA-binding domain-containing protein 4 [Haplosporangium sp. Z 11]